MGRRHRPALVFIASDETHAFAGFELDATDYLIWPCTAQRFSRTIARLRQFCSHFKLAPDPETRWNEKAAPAPAGAAGHGLQTDTTAEDDATVQVPLADDEQDGFLDALKQAWDYNSTYRPVEIEKLAITYEGKTLLLPYDEIVFVEGLRRLYLCTHGRAEVSDLGTGLKFLKANSNRTVFSECTASIWSI